ncbi:MAG: carotenoid 1,2-hydratase, partial [Aeromonas sobria]
MKPRLSRWLSHGLTTPLTGAVSPAFRQRREDRRAAASYPLSLRERVRVRGILCSLRTRWLAALLL